MLIKFEHLFLAIVIFIVNFIIACFVFYNSTFQIGPDQVEQMAPIFFRISNDIAQYGFSSAIYSPQFHCGIPHFYNPLYNPIYPLYFNWIGADSSIYETLRRLDFIVLLHFAILGSGIALMTRIIPVSLPLAAIAGLILTWLPAIQSIAHWTHSIAGLAWIPFIIYVQLIMFKQPSSWIAPLLLSLFSCFLIFAQPAANLIFIVIASFILWSTHIFVLACKGRNELVTKGTQHLLHILSSVFIIYIFCGHYLHNLIWFHNHSIRWLGDLGGFITNGDNLPKKALLQYAMNLSDIKNIFVYSIENTRVVGNLFIGPAFVFGGFAAVVSKERLKFMPLIIIGCVSLLFTFDFFVSSISYNLPLVNKIREVGFWSILAMITLIPVSIGGIDIFATIIYKENKLLINLLPSIIVIAIALFMRVMNIISITSVILIIVCSIIAVLIIKLFPIAFMKYGRAQIIIPILALGIFPILDTVKTFPANVSMAYSLNYQKLITDAEYIVKHIPISSEDRIYVDPLSYANYKTLSMVLGSLGYRVVHVDGHPLLYEKFLKTFFPHDEATKRALGIRWIIYKATDGILLIKEIKDYTGLVYVINQSNSKLRVIEKNGENLNSKLYRTNIMENETIIINEDFRANIRIYLNGVRFKPKSSALLQCMIENPPKGSIVVEIKYHTIGDLF